MGSPIVFADDLDIAADGTVWFSDASARFGYEDNFYDFLEGRATGRLLSYDPASGQTRVRLTGLFFAHGVALGPDDDYVLVNESMGGRVRRLWLRGPKAGQSDLFAANLPGTPDNISFNGRDTFRVAMPALRSAADALAGHPLLRKVISRLPYELMQSGLTPISFVMGFNLHGEVVQDLQDNNASYHAITSANECDGSLYLGSIPMDAVGRYPL
jgi:sugar lactone lactonase YvrE